MEHFDRNTEKYFQNDQKILRFQQYSRRKILQSNILPEFNEDFLIAMKYSEFSFNIVEIFCAMWVCSTVKQTM